MNIIQYVNKNKATFAEQPINEADSLVFAELAYMNFGRGQSGAPRRTLGELTADAEKLTQGTLSVLYKHNIRLLKAVHNSPRFAPVAVGYFRTRASDAKEQRFAAVTMQLCPGRYHIAYRGTGVSLVGWLENLKMSLLNVIPTQRVALRYLCDVASRVEGTLSLGGLSKGGNLSVFASSFAPSEVQQRIIAVFDHDGPGFKESIFHTPGYLAMADRVFKTVPHDSVVGMLLCTSQQYDVVESTGVSITQHDPFTWVVKDCFGFKKLPKTTRASQATDTALSQWLEGMNNATRRRFVEAVFAVVEGSGAKEVGDLLHRPLHKIRLMRATFNAMSPEQQELLSHGGKQLLSLWLGEIFSFARLRAPKRGSEDK